MSTTRYEETATHLRDRIEAGDYLPGSRLPSVRSLVTVYDVSDATVRAALRILESEGLVTAQLKSGIVVRERSGRRRLTRSSQISHDGQSYRFPAAAAQGEPWISHGAPHASVEPVPADVAAVLQLAPGSPVVRRRRVMSPQGEEPWDIIDTWIPPHIVALAPQAAEPATGPGGYLARIEETEHGPLAWEETARATMPTREEAELLRISSLMPVMRILRTGLSAADSQPAECSSYVIPSDRVEIHSALTRGPSARWPVSYS